MILNYGSNLVKRAAVQGKNIMNMIEKIEKEQMAQLTEVKPSLSLPLAIQLKLM